MFNALNEENQKPKILIGGVQKKKDKLMAGEDAETERKMCKFEKTKCKIFYLDSTLYYLNSLHL